MSARITDRLTALGARIAAAPGARASRRNTWLLRAAAALAGFAGVHLLAQARTAPREPGALELLSATGRSQARPPTHTPPELALLLRLADRSETR